MPYVVDATNQSSPADSDPPQYAAAEFRALKTYVRTISDQLGTLIALYNARVTAQDAWNANVELWLLAHNQSWTDVTSSRAVGVTYTNTTNRPIVVNASVQMGAAGTAYIAVNGVQIVGGAAQTGQYVHAQAIVPVGHSYLVNANATVTGLSTWMELRA